MASIRPVAGGDPLEDPQDFSLVLGGPLYQLLRRAHMAGNAPALVRRRALVLVSAAWLPLLVLSAVGGQAFHGVAVPFVQDVDVHARFLLALPLLIAAELVVHQRMRLVLRQFRERKLVPADGSDRFDAAVASAFRLRNSMVAEVLLLVIVYLVGVPLIWRNLATVTAATWYATPASDGSTLSLAGWWFGYVSIPVFQFLLLRWYFRIFVWMRFLWRISRIELKLAPMHPDRVGGLGFLASTAYAFVPLGAAHGTLLAGWIANRIFHLDAGLLDFKLEVGVAVALMLLLVFGPFLVFAPQLAAAKRQGLREYGTLAAQYVRDFDAKWLRGGAQPGELLLGSADVQSLADLNNSYEVVRAMRAVPIARDAVLQIAAAVLLPIVPLALTMMSLEELLERLAGIVL